MHEIFRELMHEFVENVNHLIPCVLLLLESKYFQSSNQVNRIRGSHPNSQLYALNSLQAKIIGCSTMMWVCVCVHVNMG